MLVTRTFVLLNNPKTGSSFCRTVLKEIHAERARRRSMVRRAMSRSDDSLVELLLPNIKVAHNQERDQHGTWSQIPEEYRDREVASVVRNPYDRFLSMYQFRWWEKHPPVPADVLMQELPHFPDLSLDDFVTLNELAVRHGRMSDGGEVRLGNQSAQFIQMFFRNPSAVLERATRPDVEPAELAAELAPITFLRQENLNHDFASFLARHGYTDAEVDYARTRPPVNVTRAGGSDRRSMWTPTALDYVGSDERFLIETLNGVGIRYERPVTL